MDKEGNRLDNQGGQLDNRNASPINPATGLVAAPPRPQNPAISNQEREAQREAQQAERIVAQAKHREQRDARRAATRDASLVSN